MPEQQKDNNALVFIILGWVFSALSLIVLPIIFGPAGIVFGALTISKGKKTHGIIIIVAAIVFAILGFTLGYIIASNAGA
ncbi:MULTISPECIES: hypothetical protein [Staphylococcus]|uniref:DUF4190 domain-containing protein n=2 Tax=Staphylococcus TaxID=1279 RepID=A0ABY1H3C2_9STAP|nr:MULTISPECIES: hypothetical protein [Staphylococcus]ATH63384.1 hypothetical protein BJG87_10500 [Staphylococcus pasteuri]KKI56652.1 hypothetical protein UF70_0295 [Staphylococcus pasteuri]MBM6506488.1 hypothetical protein [Staphylococcus pasteuri]MCE3020781.1 hypothetical protein [Staphylococcus pasteuri]MDI3232848.1 hypothetical protein [Staphylococcus pasteuri]